MQEQPSSRPRVLYISHGAGPMPLLGDDGHREMVENLEAIATSLKRPSQILLVSAHWEEDLPAVTGAAEPSLLYDYYGFPEAAYQISYPAPGDPELANTAVTLLRDQGISASLNSQRGFDHGLFVPLKIMFPEADIPCIQLSLVRGLDPGLHIEIGRALTRLDQENLLVIGSGFSFHNMRAFFAEETAEMCSMNESFESWLIETCASGEIDEKERSDRLLSWESAPSARFCHPREEHLLPLHVCYGVAGRACSTHFELQIIGKKASVYLW